LFEVVGFAVASAGCGFSSTIKSYLALARAGIPQLRYKKC
jgi:hypothetical protein